MKGKVSLCLLLLLPLIFLLSSCSIAESILPATTDPAADAADEPASSADSGVVVPTATASADPLLGLATVESVEIMILESFPVQINVRVTGVLPDDCTEIEDVVVQQEGNAFNVAVTSVQTPGDNCGSDEVLFEEIVPLDVNGLEAGSYTVSVNGVQGSFKLDMDNAAQEETAAATAEPTAPAAAAAESFTVNGRVWHDICSGVAGDDNEPPAGCVSAADGGIIGDGLLDNEPGIEGVLINLGPGACPSTEVIITAATDAEGVFSFANLSAADYCISVDNDNLQNQAILLPGRWSAPTGEVAETTITVGENDAVQEILYGWDYELLPVDLTDCSNSFEFVEDLNIPDDTVFAPGEEFTKEWRLRNNGTCPWSTDYAVQFVGGDQMGAEESIPLTESVAVSQTLDVAVDMVAPDEPGTYRGNWQVANPEGEPFGIDGFIEDAFWLRIIVDEDATPSATPSPNSGAIGGVVWDDFCINSNPGRGCVESAANVGAFIADGSFDALETSLSAIAIGLAEGACPSDGTLPAAAAVIETAVTDEDGRYLFDGLSDGNYCIFMDALSAENVDALIPGNWTWPATGVGYYSFILDPGEQALDLDFGWDHAD